MRRGAEPKSLPAPHRVARPWIPVAQLNKADVHRGALTAISEGLRRGIGVRVLNERAVLARTAGLSSSGDEDSEHQLAGLGARWALETDPAAKSELERQIQALRERSGRQGPNEAAQTGRPQEYTLTLDMFERAMRALLLPGSVPRDLAEAADVLIRDLTVHHDTRARVARFSANLRLPTVEGAVILAGPFTWQLPFRTPRGALAARQHLGENATEPMHHAAVTATLRAHGLTADAAETAVMAPMKWLVPALLNRIAGQPMPPDAPDEWRARPFMDWLVQVYGSPTFTKPANRRYTLLNFTGQLVVHTINELDGFATVAQILQRTPINLPISIRKAATTRTTMDSRDGRVRPTPHAIDSGTPTGKRPHGYAARQPLTVPTCRCGAAGTWVCSAPELPRSLLCANLHMIDAAEFGMAEDVVFPADYIALAPSIADCHTWLTREYSLRDNPPLGAAAAAVLELRDLAAPDTMSTREVAMAIGRSHATTRVALHGLARHGRVRAIGELRHRRWQLIDDATLQASRLRSDAATERN